MCEKTYSVMLPAERFSIDGQKVADSEIGIAVMGEKVYLSTEDVNGAVQLFSLPLAEFEKIKALFD